MRTDRARWPDEEEAEMGRGKRWKQEEKMAIVLEGLQGRSVKEVCAS